MSTDTLRAYHRYLWCCLLLVLCMVTLGGVTRLTGSGLSIVEWKLVHGTLPPLSHAEWEEEFAAYRASPEYIKKNAHMQLQDFKGIFWLEYWHRVLGRIIGMVFLLPALYHTWKKSLPTRYIRRNWVMVGMVCAQGLMGWLMVKSGLSDNPHVSHYRLAAHLLLATFIAVVVYSTIMQVNRLRHSRGGGSLSSVAMKKYIIISSVVLALIVLQVFYGALVAGLKAGFMYNEFPLMGGQFFPPEHWTLIPAWRNLLEHHATVQFIHRWLGCVVLAVIMAQYLMMRSKQAGVVLLIALLQVGLGVATLVSGVQIALATLHQLVAIILVLSQCHIRMLVRERTA